MPNARLAVVAAALDNNPRQAAPIAHQLGFSGMQFDAASPGLDLTTLSGSGRREFLQILAQQDQRLVGLRADSGVNGLGPGADVDRLLWRWDKILETAAGLQAPLVCLDLGPLPAANPAANLAAATPPPDPVILSQVDAGLAELGRRADRYGVTIAMRSDRAGFAAIVRALDAARCPMFGVDFDPVALLHDTWTMDDALARLGGSIRHLRGRDALLGADRRTRPVMIGRGNAPWPALLPALDAAGFHGWITIDPLELTDRKAAAAAGLSFLQHL